jgi:hypothetical protein
LAFDKKSDEFLEIDVTHTLWSAWDKNKGTLASADTRVFASVYPATITAFI